MTTYLNFVAAKWCLYQVWRNIVFMLEVSCCHHHVSTTLV